MRAWNSGSLANSLPRRILQIPAIITPANVAGIVIDKIVTTLAWKLTAPNIATMDTTATEAGDAQIPIWDATDATAIGRSGRIPSLIEIS